MVDDGDTGSSGESFLDQLKTGYDEFISSLEEKGVPAPNVLIPVLVLLVIAGVAAFAFNLSGGFASTPVKIPLQISDANGQPLNGITAQLKVNSVVISTHTANESGQVVFSVAPERIPKGAALEAELRGENFQSQSLPVIVGQVTSVVMQPGNLPAAKVLLVKVRDSQTKASVDSALVDVSFDSGTQTGSPCSWSAERCTPTSCSPVSALPNARTPHSRCGHCTHWRHGCSRLPTTWGSPCTAR